MVDALVDVLSTHGLAGLCLGFFAYLCFDQHQTIKKMQSQVQVKCHQDRTNDGEP